MRLHQATLDLPSLLAGLASFGKVVLQLLVPILGCALSLLSVHANMTM